VWSLFEIPQGPALELGHPGTRYITRDLADKHSDGMFFFAYIHGMCECMYMIRSFGDKRTEQFYHGIKGKAARTIPTEIRKRLRIRLDQIEFSQVLDDLRVPPSNRLELLRGELAGCHSIRVTRRWRILFRWDNGAHDVRLCDYHE